VIHPSKSTPASAQTWRMRSRPGSRSKATGSPSGCSHLIGREISRAPFPLTTEQAAAVKATIQTDDGVSVIEALDGTGKTFTAGALSAIYERAGYAILGAAPTAGGARELSEQAGISSRTLDRFLLDIEQLGDELPRRCIVILDEAGMAPTRSSARRSRSISSSIGARPTGSRTRTAVRP
jgi:ATP-dependent exoDNAse (exonuclease V) alpha subunit